MLRVHSSKAVHIVTAPLTVQVTAIPPGPEPSISPSAAPAARSFAHLLEQGRREGDAAIKAGRAEQQPWARQADTVARVVLQLQEAAVKALHDKMPG